MSIGRVEYLILGFPGNQLGPLADALD